MAYRSDRAGQERCVAKCRASSEAARVAAGKSAVFSGKNRAAAGTMATRVAAYRASHRAVFLSPKPDKGHERGDCDLRSLPYHEPTARAGTDIRRQFSRIPAVA